ncbi:MAG: Rne/Rng family ribonuclease [Epulopiscium sp.]|nr:Rne/Rng family ribonuclease [Candidatus Epulonipiscium sp.]
MEKSIIIDEGISYTRVALMEDDRLVNIHLENNYEEDIKGTIYQGMVSNLVKGMKAAFIDIGQPKKAFLHYKDVPEKLKGRLQNNQRIMVQVVKEGVGSKGPKVSSYINITGKYLILLPYEKTIGISRKITNTDKREELKSIIKEHNPKEYGLIVRTGASKATDREITQELDQLTAKWEEIETRAIGAAGGTILYEEPSLTSKVIRGHVNHKIKEIVTNSNYQDDLLKDKVRLVDKTTNLYGAYGIDKEIQKALSKRIWLKSGANIIIEKTEAMNVIDVNSAKLVNIKDKDKMALKANLEAATESARQIRIRNLSGIIIIDFIAMNKDSHKEAVVEKLQAELNKDRIKARVYPATDLGIVQITRKRTSLSLKEEIMQKCPSCNRADAYISYDYLLVDLEKDLREVARESIHKDVEIKAASSFIEHIKAREDIISKIKEKYGINTRLTIDNKINKGKYEIHHI